MTDSDDTGNAPARQALLPCPFCGGEAEMDRCRAYRNISTGRLGDGVAIYCLQCSADMMMCRADTPDLDTDDLVRILAEAWNRRTARQRQSDVAAQHGAPPTHPELEEALKSITAYDSAQIGMLDFTMLWRLVVAARHFVVMLRRLEELQADNAALRATLDKICGPITVAGPPDVVSACQDLHGLICEIARAAAPECPPNG